MTDDARTIAALWAPHAGPVNGAELLDLETNVLRFLAVLNADWFSADCFDEGDPYGLRTLGEC